MLARKKDFQRIQELLNFFPVAAILGARQCGKTTLAKQYPWDHYFDLENPRDLARLEHPQLALEDLKGLIVIDEIQRIPDLFPLLRYLVDQELSQSYLILGSASQNLIRQSSESLAGRIGYHQLSGFSLEDVGYSKLQILWLRGGYPKSFLADSDQKSFLWRENYISTFLERDIPQLGFGIPASTLRRFWTMLGHYHGQVVNYAEIGRAFGMSDYVIRKNLEILEGTFMIRLLQPWYVNVGKRLVKRPKLYFRDTGILHALMSIQDQNQLFTYPKLGASWEGFALEVVSRVIQKNHAVYFWSTHRGAEVDLFWQSGGKNWAVEFKYMDAPKITKSMKNAIEDLELAKLWIVYPGKEMYELSPNISVIPLQEFREDALASKGYVLT